MNATVRDTNFQNCQFLTYSHVMYLKKNSQISLITDLKQKSVYLVQRKKDFGQDIL